MPPAAFVRDDGSRLTVVPGFRDRVLAAPRKSVQPKPDWTARDYDAAAEKKLSGSRRLRDELGRVGGSLDRAGVLEVGAGAGIDALLLGLQPVERVVGIDLEFPLLEDSPRGEQARRLTDLVLARAGVADGFESALRRLPVSLVVMDATRMDFPDASFDLLISRAALEHVAPIDRALSEMARVVRPGGLMRHVIDQFYWLKGCHKGAVVDIPWAHARLSAGEYRRFVAASEGEGKARRRSRRLATLNQLSLRRWRELLDAGPFEILDWQEARSDLAETLLGEHPDVTDTLLDGVTPPDLVHSSIKVWLRNR
jgi:SAM-dependent methyltransferase